MRSLEESSMTISYKKLWKLMIDKGIEKKELRAIINSRTVTKISRNENVNTDTLIKICEFLNCDIGDICEAVSEDKK
jgi:DNA-binding Xre family transcriptional regulator